MNDETRKWLEYADENLASARILLGSQLYNPCLQNIQQAVEKLLKACLVESKAKIKKTHSIVELVATLAAMDLKVSLTDDEMDLLDSILAVGRRIGIYSYVFFVFAFCMFGFVY